MPELDEPLVDDFGSETLDVPFSIDEVIGAQGVAEGPDTAPEAEIVVDDFDVLGDSPAEGPEALALAQTMQAPAYDEGDAGSTLEDGLPGAAPGGAATDPGSPPAEAEEAEEPAPDTGRKSRGFLRKLFGNK